MKNLSEALADCATEEEVKFAFVRYFSRMFKKYFGTPPSAYVKGRKP